MAHWEALRLTLKRIDKLGYKAYRELEGSYEFPGFVLIVDHVQGDPFAPPSRMRILVPWEKAPFDPWFRANPSRQVGFRDFITRRFHDAIKRIAKGNRGIGNSGRIAVDSPGQEILDRSSVLVSREGMEVRFFLGLPASGRTILAHEAQEMFFGELPKIVEASLRPESLDAKALKAHVECCEDQDSMRSQLEEKGLVAFLANGSILPRRSGVDDRPLVSSSRDLPVVPMVSPRSLEVTLHRPNGGPISGMGIPRGVTLIVGGGFHGKSTLLKALERCVYNHIPGDGREWVVTDSSTVKIRAEDGRFVEQVDISPFINHLPFGKDTRKFSTDNASGSTSQAANIMEALEVGARVLLMDEDTSATNFMIRDERMQALVPKEKEPITPFVDKVRQLYRDLGVSTVLVMGGSGDYFDVADTVILMDHFKPVDARERVATIRRDLVSRRKAEGGEAFGSVTPRMPLRESFDAHRRSKEVHIDVKGLRTLVFGTTTIDLELVEQLVDQSQTRALGQILYYYAMHYADGRTRLREGLQMTLEDLRTKGFDVLATKKSGNLAVPRIFEVAAAVNRMRTLKVRQG